jgi:S-adenosylhomocysteine hydrolase
VEQSSLRTATPGWDKYCDDVFLIVGFTERTGRSVAQVFERQGIRYKISDVRPRHELDKVVAGLAVAMCSRARRGPNNSRG